MRPARTTPACAGSTQVSSELANDNADHPRLRGEHQLGVVSHGVGSGPPPPARGAPRDSQSLTTAARTTPACAGSTKTQVPMSDGMTDHPRLRGEHNLPAYLEGMEPGPPPPARGAPAPCNRPLVSARTTPACAGSTRKMMRIRARRTDHPRLRGEHFDDVPVAS